MLDYTKYLILHFIPDTIWIRYLYRKLVGKKLNLKHPQTFNEKLQWLKLYDRNPEYTKMVDKYEVKKFVAERIGEQYIIPTLGVWNKFDDIDFGSLPNQFVLKCTHDSGGVVIVKDKNTFDKEAARKKLSKNLKRNFYWFFREWPYKNVKPRIIAEQYLSDIDSTVIDDYKVMCFDGEPKMIQVHKDRFTNHTEDFYDLNWNKMKIWQEEMPMTNLMQEKPINFDCMIKFSKLLSESIPQLRVDWYNLDGKLYFGELTFFDGAGFDEYIPDEWNKIFGDWIKLP